MWKLFLVSLFIVFVKSDEVEKFNLIAELGPGERENITSSFILPEEIYRKAYRYTKDARELKHLDFDLVVKHINYLESWKAPKEIVEDFPYYLAGYDTEGRPIWMAEAGKYNVKKWVVRGGKDLKNVEKYMFQAAIRILKSIAENDKPDREVTQSVFLGDAEGLDMSQITHVPTVNFVMKTALTWMDVVAMAMAKLIVVNANYATQVVVDIARPIAGKLMERVDLFGTNKAKWLPELRRLLPEETIPTPYGGKKSFKPLLIYG